MSTFIAFSIAIFIYIIPSLIAGRRNHHNGLAIFVLNMVTGWTIIGWIIALIWACTAVRPLEDGRHLETRDEALKRIAPGWSRKSE